MEASSGEIDSAASGVVRWPVRVETGHYAHPVAPEVYDCVKFLLAREGSGTITGDWGERRFRMGDLMLNHPRHPPRGRRHARVRHREHR